MSLKVEQIDLRFLYTFKNFSSFSFNFNFSPFFNSDRRKNSSVPWILSLWNNFLAGNWLDVFEVTLKIRGKSYRFDGMIAKATEVASNFVNFTDSSNFTRQGMPQIKTCQFQRELSSKSGRCVPALENEIAPAMARNVANFWNSPHDFRDNVTN